MAKENTDTNFVNFILEIGLEELPAKQVTPISNHIKNSLSQLLIDNEIKFGQIETLNTPRRLFFEISDLESESKHKNLEIKGPPANIGIKDNTFTKAAISFAQKNNIKDGDLFVQDDYIFGKLVVKPVSTKELLAGNLPHIITAVPGERFMRWGNGNIKFSRPIQWIASLMTNGQNREAVNFNLDGLESGTVSYGHRFLGPQAFEIENKTQYIKQLEKQGVCVNQEERKTKIINESQKLAKSVGGEIIVNEDLLQEIAEIVENPAPILCGFDTKFLAIPDKILTTVMIAHQRYFPIIKNDKLVPYFIAVSNNPLEAASENIRKGNEKVIVPRFRDAEFFVNEDMKTSLRDRLLKLEKINFQAGNMLQKAHRIQKISKYLIDELKPTYDNNPEKLSPTESLNNEITVTHIEEAALLAKADLTTQLVFEFTELQGEIGGIYAEQEGLHEQVTKAIMEHYKPRFAGDDIPESVGGKIIAIADKIDNIVCFFASGKIPKGSADPFALRRQANGLLEIIVHSRLIIDVDRLVDYVVGVNHSEFIGTHKFDWEFAKLEVKNFLKQRLGFVFDIYHKDPEIIKAILSADNPLSELNRKHMLIHFLMGFKSHSDFPSLVEAINRLSNIGKKDFGAEVDTNKLSNDYERTLFKSLTSLEKSLNREVLYEQHLTADLLVSLIQPINNFFDNVLVNDGDENIKKNRNALVNYGKAVFEKIGDFRHLKVKEGLSKI